MNNKSKSGFTLIELLIWVVIFIVVICMIGPVVVLSTGNYWYTSDDVLKELQSDYPTTQKILETNRKIFSRSIITVRDKDGTKKEYFLDSNILWDYEFELKE